MSCDTIQWWIMIWCYSDSTRCTTAFFPHIWWMCTNTRCLWVTGAYASKIFNFSWISLHFMVNFVCKLYEKNSRMLLKMDVTLALICKGSGGKPLLPFGHSWLMLDPVQLVSGFPYPFSKVLVNIPIEGIRLLDAVCLLLSKRRRARQKTPCAFCSGVVSAWCHLLRKSDVWPIDPLTFSKKNPSRAIPRSTYIHPPSLAKIRQRTSEE